MNRIYISFLILAMSCASFSDQREIFSLTGKVSHYQNQVDKGSVKSSSTLHSIARADFFGEKASVYVVGERYSPTKNRATFSDQNGIGAGYILKLTDFFRVDTGFKYNYKNTNDTHLGYWREVYTGVNADIILSPSIYLKHDFDRRQFNIELAFGYEFDLDELGLKNFAIDADFYLGWLKSKKPFGQLRDSNWNRKIKYLYYTIDLMLAYFIKENIAIKIGPSFSYNSDKKTIYSVPNEFSKKQRICSMKFSIAFAY